MPKTSTSNTSGKLRARSAMNKKNDLCMLMILDGWGLNKSPHGNAIALADTPNLDRLAGENPSTILKCSGANVGLPPGIMGNSEVGHLNIGAGRIVYQDLLRIDMAISDGSFGENPEFTRTVLDVKEKGSALHLMGLVSDGGVHSQLTHLLALLSICAAKGLTKVFVHVILDGRDTLPTSGAGFVDTLQGEMEKIGTGSIATICGRYYAMDRDTRWERTEAAYDLYTLGIGRPASDPVTAVRDAYTLGENDEFVKPILLEDQGALVKDDDAVIFFNFRADRARQITSAFTDPTFDGFKRKALPKLSSYVCMTSYGALYDDLPVAFSKLAMKGLLGETVAEKGIKQLRIAETEKYAHVTYFFNGGGETPFPLEDRCLIDSPRDVATYDLKPEMSADAVADEVIERIRSEEYGLIVLNFANMDMVGHTGIMEAAVKACETVDRNVGRIADEVLSRNGALMITADHGNAEMLLDDEGNTVTAHTTNPVPLIIAGKRDLTLREGILADIAPTILHILGIEQPPEMTGTSLIEF